MKTITLKDVPVALHKTLKAQAKAHGRSLNKEIISTLENTVNSTPVQASVMLSRARAVRETMRVRLTQKDLDAFKNAGRR